MIVSAFAFHIQFASQAAISEKLNHNLQNGYGLTGRSFKLLRSDNHTS
jgi:hypothetical protein